MSEKVIPIEDQFSRWCGVLRLKASQYEHPSRKKGDVVTEPDLDIICNEMQAFINGYKTGSVK